MKEFHKGSEELLEPNALRSFVRRAAAAVGRSICRWKIAGPFCGRWKDSIRGLNPELEALNASTEEAFLSLGAKLDGFSSRCRDISNISSSVAELMTGSEIVDVVGGFQSAVDFINQLEGDSEQSLGTLRYILEQLGCVDEHQAGFRRIAKVLRVLCVSTRIESARLGENDMGFNELADDVNKLAQDIEAKYAYLQNKSELLRDLILGTCSKVVDLEATQRGQAAVVRSNILSGLTSLKERHSLASANATRIVARYDAIFGSIREVVESMQYHDITRQRIEHCRAALAGLIHEAESEGNAPVARLLDGRTGWLKGKDRARMGVVGRICRLQMAQLSQSGDELIGAAEAMIGSLRQIGSHVAQISEETNDMAGAAGEAERSFFSQLEAGFSSIGAGLAGYGQADQELNSVMAQVAGSLRDMSAFAVEIERIGTQIKLIALNANVKACHLSERGAALSVLAESVHLLSVDTCRLTSAVSGVLRTVTSAADELSVRISGGMGDRGAEVDRLRAVLGGAIGVLRGVNESTVSLLGRMNEEGLSLSDDIEEAVAGIHVQDEVREVLGRVTAQLSETVERSQTLAGGEADPGMADLLKDLEGSYTMRREREIHESMAGQPLIPGADGPGLEDGKGAGDKPPEGSPGDGEDFGDNVELF